MSNEHTVAVRSSSLLILRAQDAPRFGRIRDGRFELSLDGELARECWLAMPSAFPSMKLDVFAFLPDEFRAIVHDAALQSSISAAVGWFMRQSEEQLRTLRGSSVSTVWKPPVFHTIADSDDLQLERMQILLRAKI